MSNQKSIFLSSSLLPIRSVVIVDFLQGKETVVDERPNIVFILTDDQRYDEIAAIGNFP